MVGASLVPALSRADTFTIDLKVQSGSASQTAHAEPIALGAAPKPRKVLKGKAGVPLKITWTVTNADTKLEMKNIVVHFFTVREEKLGQAEVPKLTKDVTAESALTMDFAPRDKAAGALTLTIDRRGFYLMRVETLGAPDGHGFFAALDLWID